MVIDLYTMPLAYLTLLTFAIQYFVFAFSAFFKTEKLYDVTGSATFLVLTYLTYSWCQLKTARQALQTIMVFMWATRLGSFLFIRILKTGHDQRFRDALEKPALFFIYWTLQGVWIILTLLPTLMLLLSSKDYPFSNRDYIGYSFWVIGFGIEVIADFQKAIFRNNPNNEGKFITSGLWSYSRHPNYLGEILLWLGLYLSASSVFQGAQLLTVLCPVFDMLLITKFSGIPPLEQHGHRKWGHDPNYKAYLKNTNVLIPGVW